MFCGVVSVTWLDTTGSLTGTVFIATGMVIRKMMSMTSMTSTSGVVLIVELTSSSPEPSAGPTLIDITCLLQWRWRRASNNARTSDQHRVDVGAEVADILERDLVAANQPVVGQHR